MGFVLCAMVKVYVGPVTQRCALVPRIIRLVLYGSAVLPSQPAIEPSVCKLVGSRVLVN
jgi:hypothetical protein